MNLKSLKERLINFFFHLLSVVMGIIITFTIQGRVNRLADRKNVRSALELVRSELVTNREDIGTMSDYLQQERYAAQYFLDHRYSIRKCPVDSINLHSGILFADVSITMCQDALELLKRSSIFQKIDDNLLSMKIIRAYDACLSIATNVNRHIAVRDERFEKSVNDNTVRRLARKGNIDICEFIQTDYGVYCVTCLSPQGAPSLYTDVSDLDEAILAIDKYLNPLKTKKK